MPWTMVLGSRGMNDIIIVAVHFGNVTKCLHDHDGLVEKAVLIVTSQGCGHLHYTLLIL